MSQEAQQVFRIRLGNITVGYEVTLKDEERDDTDCILERFCKRHDIRIGNDFSVAKVFDAAGWKLQMSLANRPDSEPEAVETGFADTSPEVTDEPSDEEAKEAAEEIFGDSDDADQSEETL